jgi:LacI family transcriptional regulator
LEDWVPVTIRDLAEKLNLSITTVSRALDGYADVAEETRKRVIHTAREMGYEPSYAARQLRRKRSDAIGYILPTSSPQFTDPFFVNFLTGLCDASAAIHLDLMVTSCPPDSDLERSQYRQWVQSRRIDGIVLNRIRSQDWRVDFLLEQQFPFVSLGKTENNNQYPSIFVDERRGFARLVSHLVQNGHRQIAYVGAPADLMIQRERYAGYCLGLKQAGIPFDPHLIKEGTLTETSGYNAAKQLLSESAAPTAIMACNDLMALGVLQAAQENGIRVGSELAITGFDGIKETEYTTPPITTLFQPTYEIACNLTAILGKLINGIPLETMSQAVEPDLILRASSVS